MNHELIKRDDLFAVPEPNRPSIDYRAFAPEPDDDSIPDIAATVSEWTKHYGTLLPKESAEIEELLQKHRGVIVQNPDDGELLGFFGATFEYYENGELVGVEIGSMVTNPDSQHRGIGTAASHAILELMAKRYPKGTSILALANEQSGPLFEKIGARRMSFDELPGEARDFCITCPRQPDGGNMCCDVPMTFTHLVWPE